MKVFVLGICGAALMSGAGWAADPPDLSSPKEKVNYSVGYQIGGDFKRQGIELSPQTLVKGIEDALTGAEPKLSAAEMQTTLVELKQKIEAEQAAKQKVAFAKHQQEGAAFLAENAKKEGVVVLPSGLQYKVLQPGTGAQPTLTDKVLVNYRGTRIDGKEFSSSYLRGKPDTVELARVIPGLQEALPLMKVGAKWQIFIPSSLAFGERGPLEGETVIYEVELLGVEAQK